MKLIIGNDHAGVNIKNALVKHLSEKGYEVDDMGVAAGEKCHYPEMAEKVATKVANGEYEKGILICGTGIGMSMAANKVKGIRAAVVSDYFSAKYTRVHNDANILCMGERVVGEGTAIELCDVFLNTEFDTENPRHKQRIDIITEIENRN